MSEIQISVVIPVKNGITTISRCLEALFRQSIINQVEVIVIDSGSTDGTLEICESFDLRLVKIPPSAFNHGNTRNYGVTLAQGEYVFLTVQDAIATDEYLLERMVRHFSDSTVMAVSGRQIVPHEKDMNPHQWFRPISEPKLEKYGFTSAFEFKALPDKRKRWVCGTDDVVTMYRRSALLQLPFRMVSLGEDIVWASDAYKAGYSIVFDQSAKVEHYHYLTFKYAYKSILFSLYTDWKYLGIKPKPNFKLSEYALAVFRNFKYKAHPKWILHQMIFLLAKYKANRDFALCLRKSDSAVEIFFTKFKNSIPQGKIK